MGQAIFDGRPFRIDPVSVSWDYTIKLAETKTVGGKVIQVLGSSLGDMVVEGSFGVGGWQEQAEFLARLKTLAERQESGTAPPTRFVYPPKGWDFLVYLKGFTQPGVPGSVGLSNSTPAPGWQLTLFIVEDNAGLRFVAQDAFIARLAMGIGWKGLSKFNGPVSYEEVQRQLNGLDIKSYLAAQYGIGDVPTGGQQ